MLLLIIRKEIVHNVLSFRFIITYALLLCLILLALFLMTVEYRARMEEYTTETSKERDRIGEIDSMTDPSERYEEFRQTSFSGARPPQTLSILARGLEGSLPTWVSSSSRLTSDSSEERLGRNPLFEIFHPPDLVYVVNIVISLLALLFVFDSVCGEREQGTLKLLLANSVPRDLILMGKWIGGYISVIAPFSAAVLGGFAYSYITGAVTLDADNSIRYGLVYALSLLYISVFFTLGLMISTLTRGPSTALLVSLLVWICWTLVVPNLAPVVARLTAPVPGRQIIDFEKLKIEQEGRLLAEREKKRGFTGVRLRKIEQEIERDQLSLEAFYQEMVKTQITQSQNLARLSPSASFVFAATRVAGTGVPLSEYFQQAQARFWESHLEYQSELYRSKKIEWVRGLGPQVREPNWFNPDDLPRFHMIEEPLGDSFDAASIDMLLLAVFNALFFMLSYVCFLRYEVN